MLITRAILSFLLMAGFVGYIVVDQQQTQERVAKREAEHAKYRAYELCKMYFINAETTKQYGLEVGMEANKHCVDRLN
jgi:cell division protein FtsB